MAKEQHEYLTRKETAHILRICERTLKTWSDNNIIPFVKIGGSVRYRREDIEKKLNPAKAYASSKNIERRQDMNIKVAYDAVRRHASKAYIKDTEND